MMIAKASLALLLSFLAGGHSASVDKTQFQSGNGLLPSFAWHTPTVSEDIIELKVDFNDNGPADVAQLIRSPNNYFSQQEENEENVCVLSGYLMNANKVPVTVSGCPGSETFQVVILSKRLHHTMFDVEDEIVSVIESAPESIADIDDSTFVYVNDGTWKNKTVKDGRTEQGPGLPTKFRLDIALRYDNYFLENVAKGDHRRAKHRVNEIAQIANTFFRDFEGLGTSIEFYIVNTEHVDEELRLRAGGVSCDRNCQLSKARSLVDGAPISPDHTHFLSQDPEGNTNGGAMQKGYSGWRYGGSVCWPEKGARFAITDTITLSHWTWKEQKADAAKTFAHELGHSLGMYHDMEDPTCKGHIMDYGPSDQLKGWSHCSKEAIKGWFDQLDSKDINCKA